MRNTILLFALITMMACGNHDECSAEWAACLNACLEQEIEVNNTWKNCHEDAKWVLKQEMERCKVPDKNVSIACRILAILQVQRLQFQCDSIRALGMHEINLCRQACNTRFLACIRN